MALAIIVLLSNAAPIIDHVNTVYLIANNPHMGCRTMIRGDRDLVVRFNTCTAPSNKLFEGHTDELFLRGNGHDMWHGVNDHTCELSCHIQPHTKLIKLSGGGIALQRGMDKDKYRHIRIRGNM